jgi:hypothetical protein
MIIKKSLSHSVVLGYGVLKRRQAASNQGKELSRTSG